MIYFTSMWIFILMIINNLYIFNNIINIFNIYYFFPLIIILFTVKLI